MTEIEALRLKIKDLEAQWEACREALRNAELDACPIKVGMVVVTPRDGKRYRVVDVDTQWGPNEKPWLVGNPQRADGTFGTGRRNLFNHWNLEEVNP